MNPYRPPNPFPFYDGARVMFNTPSMPRIDRTEATILRAVPPRYDKPHEMGGPQWTYELLSDKGEHFSLGVHPSWLLPLL